MGNNIEVLNPTDVNPVETLEVIGNAPFAPVQENTAPAEEMIEAVTVVTDSTEVADHVSQPLKVMHTNLSWSSNPDGEGDFGMSGTIAAFALGNPGDRVAIGSFDIEPGHGDEVCTATYSTANNHSVGDGTQIIVGDTVIGGVERAPGAVSSTSGSFSPAESGTSVSVLGVLGTRTNDAGEIVRGGISAQGEISIVCDTPAPIEPEEPVPSTTVPEVVTTTTPKPVTEEETTTTTQPVEETTTTTEQPTTTTTQPVEIPEYETLPETGAETAVIALAGFALIAAGWRLTTLSQGKKFIPAFLQRNK